MSSRQTTAASRTLPDGTETIRLATAQRLVVKVGTNVVLREDGSMALGPLAALIDSIARLRRSGRDVLLVSSGAVGLGAERLALDTRPASATLKQACAAVGQSRLMAAYEDGFARLGLATAQILLTDDHLADPDHRRNLRDTVEALFRSSVVPIVNENDTVSLAALERDGTDESARRRLFHDNDMLAALMAATIGASALLLLSDVDGLYTDNPRLATDATLVPLVHAITPDIMAAAHGKSARGRGGMTGKLAAARVATEAGVFTIIANGRRPNIIEELWAGNAIHTAFIPADRTLELSQ